MNDRYQAAAESLAIADDAVQKAFDPVPVEALPLDLLDAALWADSIVLIAQIDQRPFGNTLTRLTQLETLRRFQQLTRYRALAESILTYADARRAVAQ